MFVYSIKGNTVKFAAVICLAAVLVLSLLLLIPNTGNTETVDNNSSEALQAVKEEKVNYNKIRTNDDRIAFLAQFGWQVDGEPLEEATVKIPSTFDKVMTSYNALQQKQGLDLTKYSGKEVTRYSYKVTNYPNYSGEVTANIIVYKNKVIGGDICSADIDGFIRGFENPEIQSEATEENTDAKDGNPSDTDNGIDTSTDTGSEAGTGDTEKSES